MASAVPFPLGHKEIFLPSFKVILKNTPYKPATQASFIVPLWFSKLDLRDYLYNAYAVRALHIRTYVQQSRVQQGSNNLKRFAPKRWHRPRATKHMTVELERPFVWPKMAAMEPGEQDPFERANYEAYEDGGRKYSEKYNDRTGRDRYVDEERWKKMREQARDLLSGKTKWTPPTKLL